MKILVGCPTCSLYEYCLNEYASIVKQLGCDILLIDNSQHENYSLRLKEIGIPYLRSPYRDHARERVVESRNLLREVVLTRGYDYLLSLEQDVIPPLDVVKRLLSHKVNVVSGLYSTPRLMTRKRSDGSLVKIREDVPLATLIGAPGKARWMMPEEVREDRLLDVGGIGLGCVLIHRTILERIKFRYDPHTAAFDDMWFSRDVRALGEKIYLDTGVKCTHRTKRNWTWNDLNL